MTRELTAADLERGLDAALVIGNEYRRAEALAELAPQLTGALLERGLDAALVIGHEGERAEALAAFLPLVPDQALLLKTVRQAMAGYLLTLVDGRRKDVLKLCAVRELFTPPIVSPETLGTIAKDIVKICGDWHWP